MRSGVDNISSLSHTHTPKHTHMHTHFAQHSHLRVVGVYLRTVYLYHYTAHCTKFFIKIKSINCTNMFSMIKNSIKLLGVGAWKKENMVNLDKNTVTANFFYSRRHSDVSATSPPCRVIMASLICSQCQWMLGQTNWCQLLFMRINILALCELLVLQTHYGIAKTANQMVSKGFYFGTLHSCPFMKRKIQMAD